MSTWDYPNITARVHMAMVNAGGLTLTTFEVTKRAGLPAIPNANQAVWRELDALTRHGLVERVRVATSRVMSWRRVPLAEPGDEAAPGNLAAADAAAEASPMVGAEVLPWQDRDVILDARGTFYMRAEAGGRYSAEWPWGYTDNITDSTEGAVAEDEPVRPLVLIARAGRPIGGIPVDDRVIEA